jgi:DNA-binding response OmpR family regulator
MPDATQASAVRRFGAFEIDLQAGELRKRGMRLRLSAQPFQVLAVLVEHAGNVVTREELHSKLWLSDTFVDSSHLLLMFGRSQYLLPPQNRQSALRPRSLVRMLRRLLL